MRSESVSAWRRAHLAALPFDQHLAEGIDRDEHADDFVVNRACAGARTVQRGRECARDSEEEELLQGNLPLPRGVPASPQNRAAEQREHKGRGERETTMNE